MLFVIGQIYTRDELFIQAAYPSDSYGNLFWTVWKPGKRIWWHFSFHSWNKNEHLGINSLGKTVEFIISNFRNKSLKVMGKQYTF